MADDSLPERLRIPQPVIKKRLPSGRGAMEQPNATHDGDAALTRNFWLALLLTSVGAGLFADLLMGILHVAERVAFGSGHDTYQAAVEASSGGRRVVVLLCAGAIGGVAWYCIRRFLPNEHTEVDEAVWNGDGDLSLRRSFLTSITSVTVVGLGASIGREAAPKLMGGVSGTLVSNWLHLSSAQRRLIVACGAGAGFAAAYNVPIAGALFTAEVLCGSLALPTVLPAMACSMLATFVSWLTLPNHALYGDVPTFTVNGSLLTGSVVIGILVGVFALGFIRLIGWITHHRAKGAHVLWAMPLCFGILGVVGIRYPQLFGNGIGLAHDAFLGIGAPSLLLVLFLLKPLVTALCLEGGAAGGLFTPALASGALLGSVIGSGWDHVWAGAPLGACALIGAAATIGASMQAPLAGMVVVAELTHTGFGLSVPLLCATVIATVIVRHVDGYSIYTARLQSKRHDASLES
ncbi:MAG: chloride channel protein [Actinomycetota bacterium]